MVSKSTLSESDGQKDGGLSTVAAIDIGSNSVHLVVARMDSQGHMKILDMDKVSVRLGQAINAAGAISQDGIRRTVEAVEHMVEIATAYDCVIRAVATHATREATNHAELLDAVFRRTGLKIEVIDGTEEARLVFLGMRHAMPIDNHPCLGMDIGGGSTEIIIAKGDDIRFVTSLKLGAVTLTAQHFGKKAPSPKGVQRLHDEIAMKLGPLIKEARHLRFSRAIASSGTAKALIMLGGSRSKDREFTDGNGMALSRRQLDRICGQLEAKPSPKYIREEIGVEAARADIILAGAAIMQAITHVFHVDEWIYSSYGLREGIVVDTWLRAKRMGRVHSPHNVRLQSVIELGQRTNIDEAQARAVTNLSLSIFDQLAPRIYPREPRPNLLYRRELLYAAAWLHEVGRFVGVTGFHRHSQYLIAHARLMGFTQDERTFISLLVRYHRKSAPGVKPQPGVELTKADWEWLRFMAAILRLTTALNRTRRNRVKSAKIRLIRRAIKVTLVLRRGQGARQPIEVEIGKARSELPIVEDAWEWPVRLECGKRSR